MVGARGNRLPEFANIVGGAALDIDHGSVALGAITDDAAAIVRMRLPYTAAGQIDTHRNAVAHHGLGPIDQPVARVQSARSASASSAALPRCKRICDSREPSCTSTGMSSD